MNSRICICCGEPMAPENSHSRYAHICASCASLLDGMLDGEEQGSHVPNESAQEQTAEITEEHAHKRA